MSTVVGIDLGTTNSLVAYIKNERPEIIPNQHGKRLTPSVVGVDRNGKLHVGETAKNQLVAAPDRTVAEVKRLMGTSQRIRLGEREYTPQEISGIILRSLKDDAERFLGHAVDEAVVTVPAYFTDAQRQATKDAGELAGFRVERILNEPTAGALSYGLDHLDKEQYVLVYDLGGGTFDVSVLEMFEGVLDVKASAGNNRLGGSDFDRRIIEYLLKQFERDHGLDVSQDMKAMARLKQAAEQAKHEVSTLESTSILLPFLAVAGGQPLSLECEFSREQFELLVEDLISSTLEPIDQALHDAKLEPRHIHEVVLVGGSSRIPLVRKLLAEKFGKPPRANVNPDEAVALGAAVQAGLKSGQLDNERGIMITDVCPYTLGVEVVGNTGYQKMPGMFSPILNRNSTIPVTRSEVYATTVDRQTHVDIKVYQGESRLVKNNSYIDQYTIDGIPPAPSGAEKISVSFTYDVNGILQVKTKILSTGKEAMLTIAKSAQRMSDGERAKARERIDDEWQKPDAPHDKPRVPPAAPVGPRPLPVSPVADTVAMGGQPVPLAAQVKALVASAEKKAQTAAPAMQERIHDLVSQLKVASVSGDSDGIRRLDEKLTDLLFELESAGKMDRLGELKRRVITSPEDVEARLQLATALVGHGDRAAALRQLEKAIEIDPYHHASRRLRVQLLREDGRGAEALRELAEMVHRAPDDLELRDELAEALHADEQVDEALFHLEESVRRGGATVERLIHIAQLASIKQLLERARSALVEARRLAPEHTGVNAALRNLYVELGEEVLADQIAGAPRSRDYSLRQARGSLHEQRLSDAVAAGAPELASAFASLWSGDVTSAVRALDAWDAAGGAPSAVAEFLRGELLLIEGDRARAEAAFRRVLEHDGAFGLAWNRLGDLRQADGALREAAALYKKAILFSPDDPNAFEDLGDIAVSLGDRAEAARMYAKAVGRDPSSRAAGKLAVLERRPAPAVPPAVGRIGVLCWGPKGGAVSPIEAVAVAGRGDVIFTGNLGPTLQESARVAISCLKARATELQLGDLQGRDLHLHFTDVHVVKDGPSAGLALALAAASAYTGRALRPRLAATGGITILGEVTKVSGVREKILAGHLAGIQTVLLPRRNLKEARTLDDELRSRVELVFVDNVVEAVAQVLVT